MGWQELVRAWRLSAGSYQLNPRASLDELQEVDQRLGDPLPAALREFYRFSNGASLFGGGLQIYTLQPQKVKLAKPLVNPFQPTKPPVTEHTTRGLATETSFLREHHWPIPAEVLVFGDAGFDSLFGIWLPPTPDSIFEHPIVAIGEIFDTPKSMAVVGTSLPRFLYGSTAFHLVSNGVDDEALDAITVPTALRGSDSDPLLLSRCRKWADPKLPDCDPDPYKRGYDAVELSKLFAAI